MVASIINADKVVVKTVDEALGVPRADINAEAVDTVGYVLRTFRCAGGMTSPLIDDEAALIESEARAILDAIIAMPGRAFWESVFQAFRNGWLDVPFSPHADNANRLVSMRDANGSIRIANPGAVPFKAADVERERSLLAAGGARSDKTYRQLLADINMMV